MNNKLFSCAGVVIFLMVLCLSACNKGHSPSSIENSIAELEKNMAQTKKKSTFSLPVIQPVHYQGGNFRSPFEIPNSSTHGITNPLQAFPTNMLRFKGTLTDDQRTWGYILAPDNKLYRVKLGDIIGDHYGRIIKIYPDRIEIEEQIEETTGLTVRTTKRKVTLSLKEGP
jgi:Tfp pilus assembly protein PilP